MRTTAKLALVCLTVLLVASTAWANLLEVRVDAIFDALGNQLPNDGSSPLGSVSADGKLAFIPDGGAITFGYYIDMGAQHPTGLGGYAASLMTGDGTASGEGRERSNVRHLAGGTTFDHIADLAGSIPIPMVTDNPGEGVLTASQALDANSNPLYPLNTPPTLLGPTDLTTEQTYGGIGPVSSAIVPNDIGTDYVAVGSVQTSKVTPKLIFGGSNKAWVPGIATAGGVVNIPNGSAYGNGSFKGPLEVAQLTFTATPKGALAGARSVQVNSFFTPGFVLGGAQIQSMETLNNSGVYNPTTGTGNRVNGNTLNDPFSPTDGIGAPVWVVVGTGQGGVVPEPSTIVLLITGAVGLFLARRRWF